jgi:hypothetical protein
MPPKIIRILDDELDNEEVQMMYVEETVDSEPELGYGWLNPFEDMDDSESEPRTLQEIEEAGEVDLIEFDPDSESEDDEDPEFLQEEEEDEYPRTPEGFYSAIDPEHDEDPEFRRKRLQEEEEKAEVAFEASFDCLNDPGWINLTNLMDRCFDEYVAISEFH